MDEHTTSTSTAFPRSTRRVVIGAGAGAAGLLAAACGAGGASSSAGGAEKAPATKPTGNASYLFHQTSGPELERYQKLAEQFAQKNPGMKVEIIPTTQGVN